MVGLTVIKTIIFGDLATIAKEVDLSVIPPAVLVAKCCAIVELEELRDIHLPHWIRPVLTVQSVSSLTAIDQQAARILQFLDATQASNVEFTIFIIGHKISSIVTFVKVVKPDIHIRGQKSDFKHANELFLDSLMRLWAIKTSENERIKREIKSSNASIE